MPEAVLDQPQATTPESLGWRAGLPDDLKQNEAFVPYKTVGEFAKSHLEVSKKAADLEKKLGDYVPKLPDNATPEDRNLYYDALGRPKQPSEYEFDGEDKNSPEWTNEWKKEFHSLGLTKEQAKLLSQKWNGSMQKLVEAHNAKVESDKQNELSQVSAQLKSEWGDKYDTNVELAKRMVQKHGKEDFDKAFGKTDPAARLVITRTLVSLAALTGEDRSPQSGQSISSSRPTSFINYDKSPEPPKR